MSSLCGQMGYEREYMQGRDHDVEKGGVRDLKLHPMIMYRNVIFLNTILSCLCSMGDQRGRIY